MDSFLRELGVKQTFIVPWNPQQNPSERANGIILRPLRIMLAAANVSVRVWPFAVNQIQMVHNALANRGGNVIMPHRSANEMCLGSLPDLSKLRVMFCRMEAVIRAERDLISAGKLAPGTVTCVQLGIDSKRGGYYGCCLEWKCLIGHIQGLRLNIL